MGKHDARTSGEQGKHRPEYRGRHRSDDIMSQAVDEAMRTGRTVARYRGDTSEGKSGKPA